ncbi:MAG: NAD-dependent protein deacylase [Clostridia bacterium]|nr:NAD-dependent protein deacylase [Clostridia bacterium]
MTDKIQQLKQLIQNSNNIVFFGGAGVSTESGIPDFRSKDGLYSQKYKYPPEEILSHDFFVDQPDDFYEFYKGKLNSLSVKPNTTHYALAKLEQMGKLKCVITQNIDGLHQKAGSKNVVELHGSILRNYCTKCRKFFDAERIFDTKDIPMCECGGVIKPDVVLYCETLNQKSVNEALDAIEQCDLLIVGGTSLTVYPAANYIMNFRGSNLVIINKDATEYDFRASLVINEKLGKVFAEIMKDYKK